MISDSSVFTDGYKHAMRNGRTEEESLLFFREYCEPSRSKAAGEGSDHLNAFNEMSSIIERLIEHEYREKETNKVKATRFLSTLRPVLYAFIAAIILACILSFINNNKNNTGVVYEHAIETDERGTG